MSATPLPASRRRVRNYRLASTAVLPSFLLVAAAAVADGADPRSLQLLLSAAFAVAMQVVALIRSDEVVARLITPLLVGAPVMLAMVMTLFEGERALIVAPIVGLLAIGSPFLADGRSDIAITFASAAAVSVGLWIAGLDLLTIVVYVVLFGGLWSVVSSLSRQQRMLLGEEDAARQEARQLADVLVSASTLNETDPAAVVARLAEAARTLGFRDIGVLRPVGSELESVLGTIPPRVLFDLVARFDSPDRTNGLVRFTLDDGRRALVGQLEARGRTFGKVVALAPSGDVLSSARVRTFSALLLLAAQAIDGANRYSDQRRAVRRLLELDAAKLDFISSVSHELRTPLTVIKGLGQTLTGGRVPIRSAAGHQLIGRLAANAERLGRMVSNLLDMSRLYQEGIRVDLRPVRLTDVVRAVVERLETLSSHHELQSSLQGDPTVLADAALLEHVLENLISNAVKHTPPGTPVLVELVVCDDVATVKVIDEGPGIPTVELPRITERFFRGGDPMTRETSGLGLGLALVADILLAHGTRLNVESGEGQGSEFSFSLELLDGDEA